MAVDLPKLLELMESKDKKNLEELGGVAGLAQGIGSDITGGLKAFSEADLEHRREQFGENKMDRKAPPTIIELFLEAMQDTTIIILLFAAGSASDNFSEIDFLHFLVFTRNQSQASVLSLASLFALYILGLPVQRNRSGIQRGRM
jgi:magnesium-transporting ATPase (P-type)